MLGSGGARGPQMEGAGLFEKVNNEVRREVSPCREINGCRVVKEVGFTQ